MRLGSKYLTRRRPGAGVGVKMNGGLAGWLGGLVGLAILVLWLYAPILWAALGSVLLVTGFIIVVRQLLD